MNPERSFVPIMDQLVQNARRVVPRDGNLRAILKRQGKPELLRDQEVGGSNPLAPTILDFGPFGKNVEGLSLCQTKTYVAQGTVQTNAIQDLAPDGRV